MIRYLLNRVLPWKLRHALYTHLSSSFSDDGLITAHQSDFLHDPLFRESYQLGKAASPLLDIDVSWRAYVVYWAASRGKHLVGDFVECGVYRGFYSRGVMNYVGFRDLKHKKFYLLDTFAGFPERQAARIGLHSYSDCYREVLETFKDFENAVVIRGDVLETLPQVKSEKVCYLSIDMNCPEPEVAAAEYFWPRLTSGAVVVLDDYNYSEEYRPQKSAMDQFARARGVEVLALPTGQGLIIKP